MVRQAVCHCSCSVGQSRSSSISLTLELLRCRLRVKRAALHWIFSILEMSFTVYLYGSHTLVAYSRMDLTIDLYAVYIYALSFIFLDPIFKFRLRNRSIFFRLAQLLLMRVSHSQLTLESEHLLSFGTVVADACVSLLSEIALDGLDALWQRRSSATVRGGCGPGHWSFGFLWAVDDCTFPGETERTRPTQTPTPPGSLVELITYILPPDLGCRGWNDTGWQTVGMGRKPSGADDWCVGEKDKVLWLSPVECLTPLQCNLPLPHLATTHYCLFPIMKEGCNPANHASSNTIVWKLVD